MIRFIWKNWVRNKKRFVLLLAGAMIISAGLSYLFTLSQNNKNTVGDTIKKSAQPSYDIIVRGKEAQSLHQNHDLIAPDYLSEDYKGVSLSQYRDIEKMPGVAIAAPLAMIGYTDLTFTAAPVNIDEEPGIYRVTRQVRQKGQVLDASEDYYYKGHKYVSRALRSFPYKPNFSETVMLAGIDPGKEAELTHMKQAIDDGGRYFSQKYQASISGDPQGQPEDLSGSFPVVFSADVFSGRKVVYKIDRLKISESQYKKILPKLKPAKSEKLDSFPIDKSMKTVKLSSEDALTALKSKNKSLAFSNATLKRGPGQLDYVNSEAPNDHWKYGLEVSQEKLNSKNGLTPEYGYKNGFNYVNFHPPSKKYQAPSISYSQFQIKMLGTFNPDQLKISTDPIVNQNLDTYRESQGTFYLDSKGEPLNPPKTITTAADPFGYLTPSPQMLTTLTAAKKILGDEPISSIRVKVGGDTSFSDERQSKIKEVAQKIRDNTGLQVDVVAGASAQPVLIHVLSHNEDKGWMQQVWLHLGTSFTIFHETTMGFTGIIGVVLAVAVLYVLATHLVSLLARRKELAMLLAIGWRIRDLARMMLWESLLLGGFVVLIAWAIQLIFYWQKGIAVNWGTMLIVGIVGVAVYLLGAIWPILTLRRIKPYEVMRTGEVSSLAKRFVRAKSRFGMVLNQFLGKFSRNLLAVLAIAMPTTLVAFFIFISMHLKGVLYTSYLGEYIAVKVGPEQYTAMIIAAVIAVLTTIEIMWQNITERSGELSLFKAVGWHNTSIRSLVWLEGILVGVIAGIIGILMVIIIIWWMYGSFPVDQLPLILAIICISIIIGFLGSLVPGELAVRTQPAEGMKK